MCVNMGGEYVLFPMLSTGTMSEGTMVGYGCRGMNTLGYWCVERIDNERGKISLK